MAVDYRPLTFNRSLALLLVVHPTNRFDHPPPPNSLMPFAIPLGALPS